MQIVNHTTYTYDCLMEFNRHYKRKFNIAANCILGIASGILLTALLVNLILYGAGITSKPEWSDVFIPLAYSALAAFLILFPIIIRRVGCRKGAAQHTEVTCRFTEDGFEENSTSATAQTESHYQYSLIVQITESEHYIYLFLNRVSAVIVDKQGFTEGTLNDFKTLLRTHVEAKKIHMK